MKNSKILIIALLVLLLPCLVKSQTGEQWSAIYAGSFTPKVATDKSGNIFVTGCTSGFAAYATVKYNTDGVQQWVAVYNGTGNNQDRAQDIAVDDSGNVLVTGYSFETGTGSDMTTVKYNSSGAQQWVAKYNGPASLNDISYSIACDSLGNVYVTGYSYSVASWVVCTTIKYNSDGVQQWVSKYEDYQSHGTSVAVDLSGNVFVAGESADFYYDYLTLKYNSTGEEQWVVGYGTSNKHDRSTSIAIDETGNVYVTGTSELSGSGNDYATIKYNSSGLQQWVSRYNGTGNSSDDARALAIDDSGNVYVTGQSGGIGSGSDYATVKYNSSGVQQWDKRFNGSANSTDEANSISLDSSGNIFVSGYTKETGTNEDYRVIKYSTSGNQLWTAKYHSNGSASDKATSMVLDPMGNTIVTGNTTGGWATVKFTQPLSLDLTALIQGLFKSSENKMIKDTVTVFLRNLSSPFEAIDSSRGILDTNGKGMFYFKNAFNNVSYYLCIKHRNSIETWSSNTVGFTSNELTYDFTSSASQAFGDNQVLVGTKYCIFSGDVNQDGAIDLTDMTMIDNDVENFASGYISTDLDGNYSVSIEDLAIAENNSFNFVFTESPLTLNTQTEHSSSNKNNKSSEKSKINSVKETMLHNNFPNPFNPVTSIKFELPTESFVKLKVYDLTGREVATLVNEVKQAGIHTVTFNGSNLSSGFYFYKIETRNGQAKTFSEVKKMTLIK